LSLAAGKSFISNRATHTADFISYTAPHYPHNPPWNPASIYTAPHYPHNPPLNPASIYTAPHYPPNPPKNPAPIFIPSPYKPSASATINRQLDCHSAPSTLTSTSFAMASNFFLRNRLFPSTPTSPHISRISTYVDFLLRLQRIIKHSSVPRKFSQSHMHGCLVTCFFLSKTC
jgi:hypothetical protein